jgi:hypothetical protein
MGKMGKLRKLGLDVAYLAMPYLEGFHANEYERKSRSDNPYEEGSNEYALWNDGFGNVIGVDRDELLSYVKGLWREAGDDPEEE